MSDFDISGINETIDEINKTATNVKFEKVGNQVIKFTTDPATGAITEEVVSDYTQLQDSLSSVLDSAENINTFDDWLAQTGNQTGFDTAETGFEDLTALTAAGNVDQQANADLAVAQSQGFNTVAEYQASLGGLQSELDAGVGAQQGLTAQERGTFDRLQQTQLDSLQYRQSRDLDSIVGSGSTARALMAADELRREFSSVQAAADAQIMLQDQSRRQYNFEQKTSQYWNMVQSGQMTMDSFMQGVRTDRMNALQAYASTMDRMMKQHTGDLDVLALQADIVYKNINAQMGIDEQLMNQTIQLFETELNPLVVQLESQLVGLETAVTVEELTDDSVNVGLGITTGLTGAVTGATAGALLGPVGAAVGGFLGFIGGLLSVTLA